MLRLPKWYSEGFFFSIFLISKFGLKKLEKNYWNLHLKHKKFAIFFPNILGEKMKKIVEKETLVMVSVEAW
jgi:hypothetical protein